MRPGVVGRVLLQEGQAAQDPPSGFLGIAEDPRGQGSDADVGDVGETQNT